MPDKQENEQLKKQLEKLEQENASLKELLAAKAFEKKAAQEMSKRHTRFMQMLNIIIYSTDLASGSRSMRGAIKETTGYEESAFLNGSVKWEQLIHPEDLPIYQTKFENLLNDIAHPQGMEYRIISGDGQVTWINDIALLVRDQDDQAVAIEGMITDVTRRKTAEEDFLEHQVHLDSILNSVQDVIWSVTPDTFELLYINPAAEAVYGCPLENIYQLASTSDPKLNTHYDLLLENFSALLQRGWFETEFSITHTSGEKRWLHRRAHFARDAHGVLARIDGIDTDITPRKQAEDRLRFISLHDGLTNLYNRFSFEEEMRRLETSNLESVGLIVLDVDGLKLINDNLGHEAGDHLLLQCSQLLRESFEEEAIVCRIGGDEFTVLIENISLEDLAASVAVLRQNILAFNQANPPLPVSLSMGYAVKNLEGMTMSEVFRQADNMMYAEKPANRQHFRTLWGQIRNIQQGE